MYDVIVEFDVSFSRNIAHLFKAVWDNSAHRTALKEEAK